MVAERCNQAFADLSFFNSLQHLFSWNQFVELSFVLTRITNGGQLPPVSEQVMTLPATLSDHQLLRLVMAADEEAFTTLYRRRQGAIYRFALQMSGCNQVAEDVTQEVFLELMREPERYDPGRGTLSAYLYGIARNQVLRRLKRDRCYVPITEKDEDDSAAIDGRLIAAGNPLDDLTRNESIEALRRAVLALPEHYREAVVLCDLHEMSYAEAADVLSCSVGTIRSRLHRGRALLADKLGAADRESQESTVTRPARCLA